MFGIRFLNACDINNIFDEPGTNTNSKYQRVDFAA